MIASNMYKAILSSVLTAFLMFFPCLANISLAQDAASTAADDSSEGEVSALDETTMTALPEDGPPQSPDLTPVIVDEKEVVTAPSENVTQTEQNTSTTPTNAPSISSAVPVAPETSGSVTGTNVMGDDGVKTQHSGTFYDADSLVPDSELSSAGATGPRKMDPAFEPGSKFMVVEKGASASSYEGQYVAATRALKLGRYPAAMEMFESLYNKNSKDPRILMGLALSQQGAGFTESAARTYEDILNVQPDNEDAIINLMGLMREQYPSVTLKKFTELRAKYPLNPGIPAQIALISADMGDYDNALKYFDIAASIDPRNASHIYNKAIVLDKKGDVKGAIQLYERALLMDASGAAAVNGLNREQIYDRLVVLRRKV